MRIPPKRQSAFVVAAGLLLLAAGLLLLRVRNNRQHGRTNDQAGIPLRLGEGGDPVVVGTTRPLRRMSGAQARARVDSFFALRGSEIGVISFPEGAFRNEFGTTELGNGVQDGKPWLKLGSDFSNHGRDALESILMEGGKLSIDIQRNEDGVVAIGRTIRLRLRTPLVTKFTKLFKIEVFGEDGRPLLVNTVNAVRGSCVVIGSGQTNPEGFLIIVGGQDEHQEE